MNDPSDSMNPTPLKPLPDLPDEPMPMPMPGDPPAAVHDGPSVSDAVLPGTHTP